MASRPRKERYAHSSDVVKHEYSLSPQHSSTLEPLLGAPKYSNKIGRKHMDKHTRPYECLTAGCKGKHFSNAGDLRRHEQEVHGKQTFTCPVLSCKRYKRGFGRKDNLVHHLRRLHSTDPAVTPPNSGLHGTPKASFPDHNSVTGGEGGFAMDEIEMAGTKNSASLDRRTLAEKLQELETMKAESMAKYDGDISALKRVLSFL